MVDRFLFPKPTPPHYRFDQYPLETIWIPKTAQTAIIPCLLFRHNDETDLMIMFSHGNGCDIGSMYELCQHYRDRFRAHVIVWEYPGYGCAAGSPNENTVNHNAWAVLNFIRGSMNWPLNRLLLFGQSIGTGPTLHIAATLNKRGEHVAGIVLQSAYTSIRDVVRHMVGRIAAVVSNRWSNDMEIKSVTDPLLLIHGRRDPLIPSHHSDTLFALADMKHKRLSMCEATHNDWDHMSDIIRPVQDFLAEFPRSAASLAAMEAEIKPLTGSGGSGSVDAVPARRMGPPEFKIDDKLRIPPPNFIPGQTTTSSSSSSIFAASLASSRALTARTIAVFSPPAAEAAIAEEAAARPSSPAAASAAAAVGNGLTSSGGATGGGNGLTSSGNGLTSSGGSGSGGSVIYGPHTGAVSGTIAAPPRAGPPSTPPPPPPPPSSSSSSVPAAAAATVPVTATPMTGDLGARMVISSEQSQLNEAYF